ncbi:IS1380-like element ISDssp4 family transposase, partial [Desulfobacterium sp. N47]
MKNLVDSNRYVLSRQHKYLTNEVMDMIKQTVLPFKIEITKDMITSHAGLALLGEFAVGLRLLEAIDKNLPAPGSGAGYSASEHILPLILMLNGGGRSLEDLRQIRKDDGLREVLPLKRMPSSDATGDWLRRSGINGSLKGLAEVNRKIIKRGLKYDGIKGYTLDIDATGIEAEKELAKMTYKGYLGYMPMVGHLAENGFVLGDEFRQGNEAPASRNLEFIKYCKKQLPSGKHIKAFRADSAAYQADIINYCHGNGIKFAIGADLDKAVVRQIKSLGDSDWRVYQNGFIAETVHCMNKTKQSFRLVVIRRPIQVKLFNETDEKEKYTVIATNRTEDVEQVVRWYSQRGQCSENRIKELKIGFGMERMPCGQFEANAVFFRIGVLAYNVGRLFVLKTLDKSWHSHQVQTLRWKLYETAGKIVFHGGVIWLKVRRHYQ